MNLDRVRELRTMAVHIRDNPLLDDKGEPIKFDMSDWVQKTDTTVNGNHCGTAACLAGHMPFWPAFKNDGWKLDREYRPTLRSVEGIRAASTQYFGTPEIYERVFLGYGASLRNVTIHDVIRRLDEIIAQNS
jgi:hypothetical protein